MAVIHGNQSLRSNEEQNVIIYVFIIGASFAVSDDGEGSIQCVSVNLCFLIGAAQRNLFPVLVVYVVYFRLWVCHGGEQKMTTVADDGQPFVL